MISTKLYTLTNTRNSLWGGDLGPFTSTSSCNNNPYIISMYDDVISDIVRYIFVITDHSIIPAFGATFCP